MAAPCSPPPPAHPGWHALGVYVGCHAVVCVSVSTECGIIGRGRTFGQRCVSASPPRCSAACKPSQIRWRCPPPPASRRRRTRWQKARDGALSDNTHIDKRDHCHTHLVSLYSSRCCLVHSVERANDSRSDANRWVTLSARRWESLGKEHARVSRAALVLGSGMQHAPPQVIQQCGISDVHSAGQEAAGGDNSATPGAALRLRLLLKRKRHVRLRCICVERGHVHRFNAGVPPVSWPSLHCCCRVTRSEARVLRRTAVNNAQCVRGNSASVGAVRVADKRGGEEHLELDALRSPARTCARAGWGNTLSAAPLDARALLGEPGSMDSADGWTHCVQSQRGITAM